MRIRYACCFAVTFSGPPSASTSMRRVRSLLLACAGVYCCVLPLFLFFLLLTHSSPRVWHVGPRFLRVLQRKATFMGRLSPLFVMPVQPTASVQIQTGCLRFDSTELARKTGSCFLCLPPALRPRFKVPPAATEVSRVATAPSFCSRRFQAFSLRLLVVFLSSRARSSGHLRLHAAFPLLRFLFR